MSKYLYKGREYSEDEVFFDLAKLLEDVVDNETEVSSHKLGKDYYVGAIYVGNDKLDRLEDIIEDMRSYGVDIVKKKDEDE